MNSGIYSISGEVFGIPHPRVWSSRGGHVSSQRSDRAQKHPKSLQVSTRPQEDGDLHFLIKNNKKMGRCPNDGNISAKN